MKSDNLPEDGSDKSNQPPQKHWSHKWVKLDPCRACGHPKHHICMEYCGTHNNRPYAVCCHCGAKKVISLDTLYAALKRRRSRKGKQGGQGNG